MLRSIVESRRFEFDCRHSGLTREDIDRRLEGWSWALAKNPTPQGALPPNKGGKTWAVRTRPRGPRREPKIVVLWLLYTFNETHVTFEGLHVTYEDNETLRL